MFVVWYDLGLVGAIALSILTARGFLLASKVPALVTPAVLAGLVAILTLAFLGVASAQIWWVTLVDCGVIAFALLIKGIYRTQRPAAPTVEGGGAPEQAPDQAGVAPPQERLTAFIYETRGTISVGIEEGLAGAGQAVLTLEHDRGSHHHQECARRRRPGHRRRA